MEKLTEVTAKIMAERFGKDNVIALATVGEGDPYVRYVNAYYEEGAFYIITYGLSNKMRQIERHESVSIAGEWFTAKGKGVNMGYFGKPENVQMAKKAVMGKKKWIFVQGFKEQNQGQWGRHCLEEELGSA